MERSKPVLLALFLTAAISAVLLWMPFFRDTFDGETHLFFGEHYLNGWFDSWEERWFGGFSVFSYPPLTHQLIAAAGSLIGLENGYRAIQFAALIYFPIAVWLFSKEVVGKEIAPYAAILAPLISGTYLMLYVFGRLPAFVAAPLVLTTVTFLSRYLRFGHGRTLACFTLFGAAASLAHHHTVLFVLPLLASIPIVQHLQRGGPDVWIRITRIFVATLAAIAVTAVTLLPFWYWFFTMRLPLEPIPHPSRQNFFSDNITSVLFFWAIYGWVIVFLPFILVRVRSERHLWSVAAAIAVLATIGLGNLTPVPRLLFRGWTDLLVFEGFSYWSAVLLTILVAVTLQRLETRRPWARIIFPLLLGGAVVWVGWTASFGHRNNLFTHIEPWEEEEILRFLNDANHPDWYYVTLGLREPDAIRISRKTEARTVDGSYYVARQRPELRLSGIGMLDVAFVWGQKGIRVLTSILNEPHKWNLKWAIVARREYDPILRNAGWIPLHPIGADIRFRQGDPVASKIWIWQVPENVGVPPIYQSQQSPEYPAPVLLSYAWGVVPILTLVLGGLLAITELRQQTLQENKTGSTLVSQDRQQH